MKKFILPSLLAVLVCLPQSVLAVGGQKEYLGQYKIGEIISDPFPELNFYSLNNQNPGKVGIIKSYVGQDGNLKVYHLDQICCLTEGEATIYAYTQDGDLYEYSLYVFGNTTAIGWAGGNGPDVEAQKETLVMRPGWRNNPLPTYFVCTEAQLVKKEFVRTWEQIPMKIYDYESTNTMVAYITDVNNFADSLQTNQAGVADVTMNLKANSDFVTQTGKTIHFEEDTHTFTVKAKMKMEIYLAEYENKQAILTMDDDGYTMTRKGFCDHLSVKSEENLGATSPSDFGKELIVRLTPESKKDVVTLSTDFDANGIMHCFTAQEYGEVDVEIIMPETDEFNEGRDTLHIIVEPEDQQYSYYERVLGYDGFQEFVTELEFKEGDTVALPQLHEPDTWELFRPSHLTIETRGIAGMPFDDNGRVMDSITAFAAGKDEVTYTYFRSKYGPRTVNKLPVHVTTRLEPQTTISIAANPGEDDNVVFNAFYNSDAQTVEIEEPITDDVVQNALDKFALGTDEWKKAIPNSMSFNLPAGKVTISLMCWTALGYELRAHVRGQEVKAINSQTDGLQTHTFSFELDEPAAVVFYLVEVPYPAPARAQMKAERTEEDAAIAVIKDIEIDRQDLPTAIEEVSNPQSATNVQSVDIQKVIRDGKLLIIRDGKAFTLQGVEIR